MELCYFILIFSTVYEYCEIFMCLCTCGIRTWQIIWGWKLLQLDTKYTISWKNFIVDIWQTLASIKLNVLLVRFLFDFQILQQQIMGKFCSCLINRKSFPLEWLPCTILYYCIITQYLTHTAPGFYLKIYQLVIAKINPCSLTRHWPAYA